MVGWQQAESKTSARRHWVRSPNDTGSSWPLVGVLAVVLVVAVSVGLVAGRFLIDRDGGGDVATVLLVMSEDPGADPFLADASSITPADQTAAREAGAAADLAPSTAPGGAGLSLLPVDAASGKGLLYGDRSEPVCDVAAMAKALAGDDRARTAWTGLLGIEDDEVSETLGHLTPLVLTRDTAVTNSRYSDGRASTFQAVLEAGTAVLVDPAGLPRVKCSCGNPLSAPNVSDDARIVGERWDDFEESAVIEVTPVDDGIAALPVVDLASGDERSVPVGDQATIELDGYLVDDRDGVHVVAEDGSRTTILDRPVAAVFDDNAGGLVFQYERTSADYLRTRQNTTLLPPESAETAAIWHLPAGATEPVVLLGSDDPADRWFSLQDVAVTESGPLVAYYEMIGPSACDPDAGCSEYRSSDASLLDLRTRARTTVEGAGGGTDGLLRVGDGFIVHSWLGNDHGALSRSTFEGERIESTCDIDCAVTFSDVVDIDRWAGLTLAGNGLDLEVCGYLAPKTCKEFALARSHEPTGVVEFLAVEGDRAFVSVVDDPATTATVYAIDLNGDDDDVQVLDTGGRTRLVTAPIVRPTEPSDEQAPSTTEPESRGASWDVIANAVIPAMCSHEPTRLEDGVDRSIEPGQGVFELLQTLNDGGGPAVAEGLRGPDGPLTAVVATCNAGGVGWPNPILFFDRRGGYYGSTDLYASTSEDGVASADAWEAEWSAIGLSVPARDGVRSVTADGDSLVVEVAAERPTDASCCPSAVVEVIVRPMPDGVDLVSITEING